MSLRQKTLVAIGVTIALLVLILHISSRTIVLHSFEELERQTTHRDMQRALSVLSQDLTDLDGFVHDYAAWDDTYAFIKSGDRAYIKSNLVDATFADNSLSMVAFVAADGRIAFAKAFDLHVRKERPLPPGLRKHLALGGPLLGRGDPKGRAKGFLLLSDGPMLVVSRPILTSENGGPARGWLIMGRRLGFSLVGDLGARVRLSLTMRLFDDPQLPPDFQTAKTSLEEQAQIVVRPLDSGTIAAYAVIKDVYGKPILILKMAAPRDIYRQGEASVYHAMLLLLWVGLIFGVVTLLLLERLVLSRLARLSENVSTIGAGGDLSARVDVAGNDELSRLANDINSMLKAIELSEEALRESGERYRILVETSPDAITMTDLNGNFIMANKQAASLYGFENVKNMLLDVTNARALVAASDKQRVTRSMQQAVEEGSIRDVECKMLRKDGTVFPAELSASSIVDAEGQPSALITVAHDITGRKRAEETLKESYRRLQETQTQLVQAGKMAAVGRLAAGVAHEINNPLAIIASSAEIILDVLRSGTVDPERQNDVLEKHLRKIEDSTFRCKSIIDDLLGFARREEEVRQALDVTELIKDTLRLIEGIADSRERRVVFTGKPIPEGQAGFAVKTLRRYEGVRPGPALVHTWPRQLQQVLLNLIVNAFDASEAGGSVVLSVAPKDDGVEIAIADTGKGIPAEHMDHIFEPFFTTKPVGKGTGLGLYLSHQIVKSLDGAISAESVVGQGTTVRIWLPTTHAAIETETPSPR